jgi:hypothetical protein
MNTVPAATIDEYEARIVDLLARLLLAQLRRETAAPPQSETAAA